MNHFGALTPLGWGRPSHHTLIENRQFLQKSARHIFWVSELFVVIRQVRGELLDVEAKRPSIKHSNTSGMTSVKWWVSWIILFILQRSRLRLVMAAPNKIFKNAALKAALLGRRKWHGAV